MSAPDLRSAAPVLAMDTLFDVVVVGGGPAGATAADDLASAGHRVLLLDRAGRPKPCGGAVPPRLIRDWPEGPFSTNLFWDRALAAGRLWAVVHEGLWFDVGSPRAIGATEAVLANL